MIGEVEKHRTSRPRGLFPWALVLLVAAAGSRAQAPPAPAADDGDVMVIRITSGRLAAPVEPAGAVTEVRPAGPPPGPAATVGALLEPVPGVFTGSRYNGAQDLRLSVRGFGARGNFGIRGIRILLDGLPLTLPDGQSTVDAIDPARLAGATVRRGPASALYGAAAGGVISLASPDLFRERADHAALGAGSWGFFDARAGASRVWDDEGAEVAFSSRGATGFRDHSNQLHHRLTLRYGRRSAAGSRLEVALRALDSPFARDPGGLTAAERGTDRRAASPLHARFDAGEEVRQQRLALRWHHPLDGDGELRIAGYWLDRDFANRLPFSATDLDRRVGGLSLELERAGELGAVPWRWVAGADLDLQDDERRRFANRDGRRGALTASQVEQVGALGVFSQWTLAPAPDLELGLGLRADAVRVDFDDRFTADGDGSGRRTFREVSPTLGATWRLAGRTRLFARLGSAFETPTTTELANPTGAGGFNDGLEPQQALGLETGVRWDDGWGNRAELALFRTWIDDQLAARPIPGQPGRFFFVNAASSRYEGLELDLRRRLPGGLAARLAAAAGRFRFDDFTDAGGDRLDGNRVPGIPETTVTAGLSWAGPAGWEGELRYRWAGSRYADDANTVRVDGFQVVDLGIGRRLRLGAATLHLSGGISNLTDERYEDNLRINAAGGRYFEPAPERSVHLQVRLATNP